MANEENSSSSSIDPSNGFCPQTKTYHSLRPSVSIPPLSEPVSVASFAISLLRNGDTSGNSTFLVDSDTGHRVTFNAFLRQVNSLACSLSQSSLSKDDVAFIITPNSVHVPVLYFALLSIGVVVSPSNPLSSASEISHQVKLVKPNVVFATSALAHKLRSEVHDFPQHLRIIVLDSPDFLSMLESKASLKINATIRQSDKAAILFSSGTTGKVKGVMLTHRNFTATIAGYFYGKLEPENNNGEQAVSLFTLPLFHVFGFFMLIRALSLGDCVVLMKKFDFVKMLEAVERYKVAYIPVTPPLVVALAKSAFVDKYDLSSLQLVGCGGAPLGKEVSEKFRARFPDVEIVQGYGMTETGGSATRSDLEESEPYGSAGRLSENIEAKIVDPETGEALPPGQRGELWLRGPMVMKGYAGDDEATAATIDSEGWLKTGDLCYFDSDGYLFIVDRLKELIKYKAYQVPPAELEHILQSIPDVADAAVIPYPDEEAGQIPMAYVVRKPGSTISAAQVMDLVAKQVAPYKKVRRVEFVNSIPKSPAGKILRRELINHAMSSSVSKL